MPVDNNIACRLKYIGISFDGKVDLGYSVVMPIPNEGDVVDFGDDLSSDKWVVHRVIHRPNDNTVTVFCLKE